MSRPGLLWASGTITKPEAISPENFDKWYNEIHIPDLLKTKGITSAFRYKNADAKASPPYLAMYPLKDVEWSESDEFQQVPFKSELFETESHHAMDCVDFDIRFYEEVQRYEKKGAKPGPTKIVISAALSPAAGTDSDFDKWYREEHLFELEKCKGYTRTKRYKLDSAIPEGKRPAYLAVHEFDDDGFDIAEVMKTTETPWASKTMGALTMSEIVVFQLTYAAGEMEKNFLPLNV